MGALLSSFFAFGTHANIFPFKVWESFVQYRHVFAQEPHTPLDIFASHCPQDSLMSSCNCIIMSFAFLIEPYVSFLDIDFQPYSPSLSHVYPCRAILYILCSLIPFLYREGIPPRVSISYTCVLALSICMFH